MALRLGLVRMLFIFETIIAAAILCSAGIEKSKKKSLKQAFFLDIIPFKSLFNGSYYDQVRDSYI